ncbi:hypothetical protein ADK93_13005 [Streptomyces sp. XY58]|nr:hypothetical protein ADK93_13005 [Streptomyces sp. XY58]
MTTFGRDVYDDVIVGGGHNGLVAAAYLARAGRSVLVLERLGNTGGAAISAPALVAAAARASVRAPMPPTGPAQSPVPPPKTG